MKRLFTAIFTLLLLCSAALYQSYPQAGTDTPVIYWVTDPNPARVQQAARFHDWLIEQGLVDGHGQPIVELRLDTADSEAAKQVIQGVSGVCGDLIDLGPMQYFQAIGLLSDITDWGREGGFDPAQTYPAIEPAITVDGRQYAFPANVATTMYWVNKSTFDRYGQSPPPSRWTLDEFGRIGKAFVDAANPPDGPRTVFFADQVNLQMMHRSTGLSRFNETMTRCSLDDPRFAECLRLLRKWTLEDHLLPDRAEQASFDTQSSYGGVAIQLFDRGQYAMLSMGRYALVQLRKFDEPDLAVSEPPYATFPNTLLETRCTAIYVGSPHKDLAKLFLSYLASEDYNELIVHDADALPPIPRFTQTESFTHPPEHPNEWDVHGAFADAAQTIAISNSLCPFVIDSTVKRHVKDAEEACMSGRLTPEQAAQQAADRINSEIERTLRERPDLALLYEQLQADQRTIEQLRAEGRTVPLSLIRNPFYRQYYLAQGWVE